jgi:hypothetical protein
MIEAKCNGLDSALVTLPCFGETTCLAIPQESLSVWCIMPR